MIAIKIKPYAGFQKSNAFQKFKRASKKKKSMDQVLNIIRRLSCEYYNLTLDEFQEKNKTQDRVNARILFFTIASHHFKDSGLTLKKMASYVRATYNHASVISAVKNGKNMIEMNGKYNQNHGFMFIYNKINEEIDLYLNKF